MKKLLLLPLLILLSFISKGQSINGTIVDDDQKSPVQNAVVALLTKDSTLYKFTRTDPNGKYSFSNTQPGAYILMTTHPRFADILEDVVINGDTSFTVMGLRSKVKLLQEVIIHSGSPLRIKGDTTVYTADSFKVSANANVEELLKKLPGIQVDKDGKIKAMGETVEKVLVDGEEFFGDDPGMAIKNLRADAVKEVQVFNKKSDQATFTGIDDGQTQKTINLKLKENSKKGYFGKIDAAGGLIKKIDPRYNDNLLFSAFRGNRKISAFLLNGNTGQDGLNWQDEQKYGGGGDNSMMSMDDDGGMMMMFFRGGNNDEEPYVDAQNGFITNVNAGLHYSNKWNDKHTLTFSPKYNSQNYINHKYTSTQSQIGDSILNDNSNTSTSVNRHNFKNKLTYEIKIDSFNSMKITANANFYHSDGAEVRDSRTTGNNGTLKNSSNRLLLSGSDKSAISGNLIFKHKFRKDRRTVSLSVDWNSQNTDGTNFLKSFNQPYFDGIPATSKSLDQMKDYETSTKVLSSKITYTEPLSKKYSLELGYQVMYNYGTNDQSTFSYSAGSGKYDLAVDSLSNEFKQTIIQNTPSAKINYSDKKFKINVGSGFGFTNFTLKDLTYNKDYKRNYVNFFPSGNITYTYKANRSIRFNYNGRTTQPTISQLQPLRNNNDYFNQYIGNPNLKPSFTNTFNISHNSYDFIKDIWVYESINLRLVSNSITNNRVIDLDSGKTITQPINTNGNININLWTGVGFKIKKIDTRFQISPSLSYTKVAEVINNISSSSKTFAPGLSISLQKSKEKKYELQIRDDYRYNSSTSSQNTSRTHYTTNSLYGDATLYYNKVWSLITEYEFNYRQKIVASSVDQNNHLLNMRLQRTFKQDEFTAYFTVRDIFNQNIGIDKSFYSNTYSETVNDRLKRYFLVGFTWNFKNKAAATK